MAKQILITKTTLTKTSAPFTVPTNGQMTLYAMGLKPEDYVEIDAVLFSTNALDPCACPPPSVRPPDVLDSVPLRCRPSDAAPIRLTRNRPSAVIDTPQQQPLRVRLITTDETPTTQLVWVIDTNTRDVTDRMRGCSCEEGEWGVTGHVRCTDHVEEQQEVNSCGQYRWVQTGRPCEYLATLPLPCGGSAFRPTDPRDPAATVEVMGCDGELLGYLYPTPREWAPIAVVAGDCCAICPSQEVLGYAVDTGCGCGCE